MNLLPSISALARRAGEEILNVYSGHFDVAEKSDRSPLTQADMRSHELIVAGLQALTPEIPVLSEEASDVAFEVRRNWERFWLVDPLDGTKEFVSRNGEFTVNIALVERGRPVLGVVFVPVQDVLYSAAAGSGAYRQVGNSTAERIQVRSPAAHPLRIVGSRSHRDAMLERLLPRLQPCEFVAVGSSIKFCLVAEGAADFYPRFGPTSEWDTAAAQAIVEAAGGAVLRTNGEPLEYNTRSGWLNPHFLVIGDRGRDWLSLLALR